MLSVRESDPGRVFVGWMELKSDDQVGIYLERSVN